MNTKKYSVVIVLLYFLSFSLKAQCKWNNEEEPISQMVTSISQGRPNNLTNLIEVKALLKALSKIKGDENVEFMYKMINDDSLKFLQAFNTAYTRLFSRGPLLEINKESVVKLVDFEDIGEETSKSLQHITYQVTYSINGQLVEQIMYLTKIDKCYYIIEPWDTFYILK